MTRYFSDRSRYELGQICPRARYWHYHHEGRGLTPVGDRLDLLFGQAIHLDIERQMTGRAASERNEPLFQLMEATAEDQTPDGHSASDEWMALYGGLTQTFRASMRPHLEAEYDWLGSEVEGTLEMGDLGWMYRLDAILRRRSDGLFFVLEAKTTSWPERLLDESRTNFQLLMEVEAMQRHLHLREEQVGGALLLVFQKGRRSKVERDGEVVGYRRISPFTYGWRQERADGNCDYLPERPKKWSGWDLTPAWTVPGWLDLARRNWPDLVAGQVQLWPTVSFDPVRIESVIRQVSVVEERYSKFIEPGPYAADWTADVVRDRMWPQNFKACSNFGGFARACEFRRCCFQPTIQQDPVASGEFEWRSPNHKQEPVAAKEPHVEA